MPYRGRRIWQHKRNDYVEARIPSRRAAHETHISSSPQSDPTKILHLVRRPHRSPIIRILLASGSQPDSLLVSTIVFPPRLECLSVVQLRRGTISIPKDVQNAITIHPYTFKMLRQQRLLVLQHLESEFPLQA